MIHYTINYIRVKGSSVWIGVDPVKNKLLMKRDGRVTELADFQSESKAEMFTIWLDLVATPRNLF